MNLVLTLAILLIRRALLRCVSRVVSRIVERMGLARVDDAVEYWVGYAVPPARRTLDESGWRPDPATAYCGRCGSSVGRGEAGEDGCGTCRDAPPIADRFVRLGRYHGELRAWVLAIKYEQRWVEMATLLGHCLGARVVRSGAVDPRRTVVIPMPMPWQRRLYRGIDHARVIAAGVARELRAPQVSVLGRVNGPPQVGLPRSERARRGRGGFRLRGAWLRGARLRAARRTGRHRGASLVGLDVILVDDVATTKASLRGAIRLLRRLAPRRVVVAVVAVTDERMRREAGPAAGS